MPSKEEIRVAKERAFPVLDEWMDWFNKMDLMARKSTMHFPHYRLASGKMHMWEDADMDDTYIERQKAKFAEMGWHHSAWTRREIVHCSDEKIHVDTQFNRYREDGSVISVNDSLYILTWENNRWGIKMRSSYAI
jgi:hypothetical protein